MLGVPGKAQAFARSQAQKSAARQGIPEKSDHPILQVPVKIDQNVAAGNEMDLGEYLVRNQIVLGKDGARAQRLVEGCTVIGGGIVMRQRNLAAGCGVVAG